MEEKKQKALEVALGQIERQFGKGSVMRLGDSDVSHDVQAISSGSLGLDIALCLHESTSYFYKLKIVWLVDCIVSP